MQSISWHPRASQGRYVEFQVSRFGFRVSNNLECEEALTTKDTKSTKGTEEKAIVTTKGLARLSRNQNSEYLAQRRKGRN
jgi:hypothetical protein